ncbi:endoplasmic reticulum-based factor for assembly of V-ATPase-domain-containing protein [Hyaloraphidium curvatum]|nr:endoplasmic reticulum-based factor for assembly of V-ATPase-domain-containing protein [Hyaloraphidium curvatum]
MVQLIVTDRIRAACKLALASADLPSASPFREEIEAAAKDPTPDREPEAKTEDSQTQEETLKFAKGSDGVLAADAATEGTEPGPGTSPVTISHRSAKELSDFLLKHVSTDEPGKESDRYTFTQLLRGSRIHAEPPKPRVKSEALLKILSDIKRKQEEDEYQRMKSTGGLSQSRASFLGFQLRESVQEFRRTGRWVSGIVNVLFSVIAIFGGGVYLGAQMSEDWGVRVLVGFGCAFIVLVAEAYFFYFYNLVPEVDDPNNPLFPIGKDSKKKKEEPRPASKPNAEALARNQAAMDAYLKEARREKPTGAS